MDKRLKFPQRLQLIAVGPVFGLALLLFRLVHALPLAARLQAVSGGYMVAEYGALLLLAGGLYAWTHSRRPRAAPSLSYQLKILGRGFFPVLTLSVGLSWLDWTSWGGSLLVALLTLGVLAWFGWWVREVEPEGGETAVVAGLLLIPLFLPVLSRLEAGVWGLLYFYGLVAASEELLFRGFIQGEINRALGRPYRIFGIPWGWGLVGSALLFGLWHLGWQVGMLNGPHVVWTVAAGLLFGLLREKSGGLLVPILLHGVMNFGPQALVWLVWGGG